MKSIVGGVAMGNKPSKKTIENGISGSGGEMAGGIENGGSDIRNGQAKIRRLVSMQRRRKNGWRHGVMAKGGIISQLMKISAIMANGAMK
jgi:hypothetical protein